MSRFTRKGYMPLKAQDKEGKTASVAVRVGGKWDGLRQHQVNKIRRERTVAFREYKKHLREVKKKVPLEQRAKMNWSRVPTRYLED